MGELPDTMAVAVLAKPGELVVEQRLVPQPGPGEVLVAVSHCGICGSDIHLLLEGWGRPGLVGGHEWSGTVAGIGPGVSRWKLGDQVVGGPGPTCGHCRRCLQGRPSQCLARSPVMEHADGAFAQFTLAAEDTLMALPADLDARRAALAEPLAVALHGITRAALEPGDRIMVSGAGPIGALTVAALMARGLGPVSVVEPEDSRRQLAQRLGVQAVLHPSELKRFAPWEPEKIADDCVDVVLECSGKKVAIEAAFDQLDRGGRLVMVGAGIEAPCFDPNRMLLNELSVCGSFIYDADGFDRAFDLLRNPSFPLDDLIEPTDVALDELEEALASLAEGRLAGKVMVAPGIRNDHGKGAC